MRVKAAFVAIVVPWEKIDMSEQEISQVNPVVLCGQRQRGENSFDRIVGNGAGFVAAQLSMPIENGRVGECTPNV